MATSWSLPSSVLPRRASTPPPPKLLVGRKDAIANLSSLLLSRRFISVVGPGGIGKTTVAVATAHALRQQFGEDGLCFVDLGSLSDPRDVPNALASVLDRAFQGVDPETYICAFLADKRILLVLDGCEHVIGATAALCERLLPNAPSLHLLTTSREALRVEGESVHLLPPLDSPREETPSAAQALDSPAVQLFMERASSGGYKGELTDAEAPVVASICRRLDGIALAIELVAGRVGAYGIQGTADLLESGAELLLQGRRSSSPRHRILQAMLDWSFKLLSADEQMVLRRLSVFVGQFTLPGAYAVASATDGERYTVPDAFARLVDKSLIWVSLSGASVSYRLLDTTRAYAEAKLAECREEEAAARRHPSYFVAFLTSQARDELVFNGGNLATYAPHMGNIRRALTWSFSDLGDEAIGIELTIQTAPLFRGLSLMDESRQWYLRAIGAQREADRGTRQELALHEALAMSSMYTRENDEEVLAAFGRSLELSEALGDGQHQLYLLGGLKDFLTRRGNFSGVLAATKRAAPVAESTGEAAEKVLIEWMLGNASHLAGDHAAGLRPVRLFSRGTASVLIV